ncbi:Tad domain-containing protein [Aliiroseovarius sp. KMU-50]|uniref:Tad domain-containing protein n=1 Tax=Aliiroseovarius salicola TaxID=3009082 RepID=A0ABT4W3K2_9RHOB|nr:Tad domain-containing protein [Aliiroseovarius sp. KMU-50]MDA5094984.1 Tad domain-containing protein [Aliiroseovarius sp. KMU-50]
MSKFRLLKSFVKDEDAALTIFGLYIFATSVVLSAIAIDVSRLIQAYTQLQITADVAAHAALYSRDTNTAEQAKLDALAVVEHSMPKAQFGEIITADDIQFGQFDYTDGSFTVSPNSRKSVLLETSRLTENGNPVRTVLLYLVGLANVDLKVESVFTTYRPICFREGIVGQDEVDIQSNNAFSNGFCMHSNDYISMNNNNLYEEGTFVSMPDLANFDLPNSGWETNSGLQNATLEGSYRIRIINKLESIINGLITGDTEVIPSYINPNLPVINMAPKTGKGLSMSDLTPGRIHYVDCHANGVLKFYDGDGTTKMAVSEVVVVSPCEIQFGQELHLEDAIIASTNPYIKSITSSSNLQVGRDDNCLPDGSAQILTLGGMEFSAGLSIFGSQLLAKKDITFTANADGIHGASIVSGGSVSGTSNMDMGFCGSGMDNNFEAEYFRLAH